MAVLLVSAMVPSYALRLFPIVTIGSAKVNGLDVLVGLTVLLALRDIARMLLRGPRAFVWVCAR